MVTLSWLHLSDLHMGQPNAGPLGPGAREMFFRDLERISKQTGPFDFVVFTGDLTQQATAKEFRQLKAYLKDLWAHLDRLQARRPPLFLAIPGNHDLKRPTEKRDWLDHASRWTTTKATTKDKEEKKEIEKIIRSAFAGYVKFWDRLDLPRPTMMHTGSRPGDFSATIEKDGLRLGVVGLNSTFLQLDGANFEGALVVEPEQFHRACPKGDGIAWANQHHLCMLLTHHPPHWLSSAAQSTLAVDILSEGTGRFVFHLFGHMHEEKAEARYRGLGMPLLRWQAEALFGMEGPQRRHGYAAFRLSADLIRGAASLRIWPRHVEPRESGALELDRDDQFFRNGTLADDEGTQPLSVPLRSFSGSLRRLRQDPILDGSPRHLANKEQEKNLLVHLGKARACCCVIGSAFTGKSTLLRCVRDQFRDQHPGAMTVFIDLADEEAFPPERLGEERDLFLRIATSIARASGRATQVLDGWGRGTVVEDLSRVVARTQADRTAPVLLIFDNVQAVKPHWSNLSGAMRAWVEGSGDVRLLLSASDYASLHPEGWTSPISDIIMSVHLHHWRLLDLRSLAESYGLYPGRWELTELQELADLGGGLPYLARLVMHHAAERGWSLAEALDHGRASAGFLRRRLAELEDLHRDAQPDYAAYRKDLERLCQK